MTMDIIGPHGETSFTMSGWRYMLRLASENGWQPAGTFPDSENSGRRVSPEDARALADALERALPDIPNHDALEHKAFTAPGLPSGERFIRADEDINPLEYYSGESKLHLRQFIELCRQGGFEIW
jgi:hypothetical protein